MSIRFDLFCAIKAGRIKTLEQAHAMYPDIRWQVVNQTLFSLRNNKEIDITNGNLKARPNATVRQRPPRTSVRNMDRGESWAFDRTELERCWPERVPPVLYLVECE